MDGADRLDTLESHQAIAALVHAYALAIRRDRPEDVPLLFAPGGTFEIRDGHPDRAEFTVRTRLESPEALRDYLLPGKGKPHPVPMIHNLMIAIDGDTATATSVMEAPIPGTPHRVLGEYQDAFTRISGRWLFAGRIYTIYGSASAL